MTEGPVRLRDAQKAIRDAYFDNDSGLFTLNCVPGAGKSVVAYHLAAEDILDRYVEGDRTPEQHVAVISFTRGEASSIVPEICARLREIVEHDLVPAADQISQRELEYLLQRVRRAPRVGTIDSVLRDVLEEIVHEVGFGEMPAVGNDGRLKRLHAACYEGVQRDPTLVRHLAQLEYAYPSEQYRDGVGEMLESAVSYCRDRRLTTREFRRKLERTLESVYPDGRSTTFDDVVAAVRRFVGGGVDEEYDDLADSDRRRIADADARLHEAWTARLDDFCVVLKAYREAYRDAIRERGVVSHTDVAHLIDAYFEGQFEDADEDHRKRIRGRYRTRIRSLIIDEAQDVSAIQHTALAHLVTPAARVFGSGDLLQSIYLWRNADPALFESAIRDGAYLGVDWDVHEHQTATTTYRCRPDVAAAINEISEPVLTDATRGNVGDVTVNYPGLDAYRDRTDGTNVHVAAFDPLSSDPDSFTWCSPVEGRGEAETVATLVSKGLDDGTFTDDDGEPLDVTVLFRWTTKMGAYEEAFTDEGLRVRNASENLFDCDAVETVLDVCEWLIAPASTARTLRLVNETELGLQPLTDATESRDGRLDRVLDESELSETQEHVLDGLTTLRDRRDTLLSRPAATYVEDVVGALGLRADPYGLFHELDAGQRVANLDALTETIAEWEADDHFAPRELTEVVQPFRENPHLGPDQPSTADTDYDVEFRTVHSAKGDESDVVVVANPGFALWRNGVQSKRFVTQGTLAGLAPPTNAGVPTDISLPPYENGVYDPDDARDPDVGLRWMTAHWSDDVVESVDARTLVGPERLRRFAANQRAEGWRLLYVAITRTRDHLVVPLPRSLPYESQPRDRWLDALRERLGFSEERTGTYTVAPSNSTEDPFDVGVNDVALSAGWTPDTVTHRADVAVTPPCVTELAAWVPRFIRPSTMYPLTERPGEYVLPHLLEKALHTATNDVPDDHPLPFEYLGPDDVGTCLHDVLTELVERDVSESTLRSRGDVVREVFDETLYDIVPDVDDTERQALFGFFDQEVLDDFVASDLWNLIQGAEAVTVEKSVDGLSTVGDVELEIHGAADFVVETGDGDRHVADVKISLAPLTDETRRRYEIQVSTYAYLFEQQQTAARRVRRSVETFGAERETITSSWPPSIIERRLSRLLHD